MALSYNPNITYKLLIDPPYWSKRLDQDFPDLFLFQDPGFLEENSIIAFKKAMKLSKILINRSGTNKPTLNPFFEYDDLYEALNAHDFIVYLCLKHHMHPKDFLTFLVVFTLMFISLTYEIDPKLRKLSPLFAIRKIARYTRIDNIKIDKDITYEEIIKSLYSYDPKKLAKKNGKLSRKQVVKIVKITERNFFKISKYFNQLTSNPLNYHRKMISLIFGQTMQKVLEDIENRNVGLNIDLDSIPKTNIDFDEIEHSIKIFEDTIKKKLKDKQSFKYALRYSSHHLNAILKDTITPIVDKDKRKVTLVLQNTYKGATIGFYEKGLLINTNKKQAIKELQDIIKSLHKVKSLPNKNEFIGNIEKLIQFFGQDKRYGNHIPYKVLSKYLKMSKQQLKSLINAIYSHQKINNTLFEKRDQQTRIVPSSLLTIKSRV